MKKTNLKSKMYLIPMIVLFVVAVFIYHGHYQNTIKIIRSEYRSKINLIEQSIYNETKYTEVISKIAEKDINHIMEENTKAVVDRYEQDSNVLEWKLKEMKKELNGMDIYIIDKELKVISSSIEEEIGLDFNTYIDFSKRLKERLEGNKFESDSINFSIQEGELKKYSYMPTWDKEYLIELSVTIKDIYPELKDLNMVYLSKDLKDKYSFVEDIRVYRYNKEKEYSHDLDKSNKKSDKYMNLTTNRNTYIRKALQADEIQEHVVKDEYNNAYRLKYIPYRAYYEKDRLTWWKSYVIEVIYNEQVMREDILYQKKLFLQSMIIISVLYFGFSFMVIYVIQKNRQIAHKDYLTDLPNRKSFEEVMECEISEANRKNTRIAILFFDIDKFKKINDTFGHNVGDQVLKEVANRIKSETRKGDMISRIGGDEFIGLISGLNSKEQIVEIGERMSALFKPPLKLGTEEIPINTSIGISVYPDHGQTIEQLILKADKAMYQTKQNDIGYKIYEEEDI